jgi:hypothetical protein
MNAVEANDVEELKVCVCFAFSCLHIVLTLLNKYPARLV